MNSCFDVEDMFVHVNWMINCWWYWNSCVKIHMCEYVVFCEKWWMMKLYFVEFGMNSWIIVLIMFENMLLMNWYDEYAIGELMMKVVVDIESLVKNEVYEVYDESLVRQKWGLIHEFWAFLSMCLCTWTINFICDKFWVWKDQNWSVWKKRFWNSKFFFWTDECSLKRRLSEPQANVPIHFWTQLAWANRERSVGEQQSRFCQEFAWASGKRTSPERYLDLVA